MSTDERTDDVAERLRIHAEAIDDGTPVPYGNIAALAWQAKGRIEELEADRARFIAALEEIQFADCCYDTRVLADDALGREDSDHE